MSSSKAPHLAILNVVIEIHELLPTGECSGKPLSDKEMKEYQVKRAFTLSVKGFDKTNCIQKLKKKLSEFNSD